MRRALTVVVLLALMGGFAFGVNRFLASRRHTIQNASTPTSTKPTFVLPGTLYVAQQGVLYRLQNGSFTQLHLPVTGQWMQPAVVPGTSQIVAVVRAAAYSDVYLIDGAGGSIVRQLSHNATSSSTIQLNHWMYWPHVAADGSTVFVSYDQPKSQYSYEIDFAIWSGSLTGQIATTQWTTPNGYTGGDVQGIPVPGGLLYAKYEIGNSQVFSRLALQTSAQGDPTYLTQATDDCNQPALSPDGVNIAMVCTGGTGLQSTRLEVAPLVNGVLGTPRVLIDHCLCSGPSWAPDGSGLVYFNATDPSGHFQLWWLGHAAGATPSAPREVTQNLDFDATSPAAWSS